MRRVLGRVMGIRRMGKIKFLDVMRNHDTLVQVATDCDIEHVKRGDHVEACGQDHVNKDGTMGLKAVDITVVKSHSLTHFPDAKMGENNAEERFIDLLANPEHGIILRRRAEIINRLRQYLIASKGFLEVETPILSPFANGAMARPFQLKRDDPNSEQFFLRIAPELNLKRLIIGGFDKVFEIGKVFRNEGEDSTHNPEFTSLELYQAYAGFKDLKELTNEILNLFPDYRTFTDNREISIIDFLKSKNIYLSVEREQARQQLLKLLFGIPNAEQKTTGKLFDILVDKMIVEPNENVPVLTLTDFPLFTSPLAAESDSKGIASRLEVYIYGKEVANGYQELTDPVEQLLRFKEQDVEKQTYVDHETPSPDYTYIRALEYGLPPCIGLGIGIDRLVMLLLNAKSIKKVIF